MRYIDKQTRSLLKHKQLLLYKCSPKGQNNYSILVY